MKIHLLSNPKNTVWDIKESNIDTIFSFTASPWTSDIWVANQEAPLRNMLEQAIVLNRKKPKACILWTHEPYFSTTAQTKTSLYDCPVYIFNIWNGRALKQNATFLLQKYPTSLPQRPPKRDAWVSKGKPICALMTYPQSNTTFTQERLSYALSGHQQNLVEIYGKGWPQGYSIGNSRDGDWQASKPDILKKYDYNLALENCVQPYYVTEKLWDSILNGCVPIYCHNGTIYDDFQRDSFFDVRDFRTHEKLWEKVRSTSVSEWNQRLNLCWDDMETLWKRYKKSPETFWKASIEEIQATLENLT
jgi:hypothetical protein